MGRPGGTDRRVLTGHYFRRIDQRCPTPAGAVHPDNAAFLEQVCRQVVDQFAGVTGLPVLVIGLDPARPAESEDPPEAPVHPACEAFAGSPYCRESWQLHLAELGRRPRAHWHKCDYGRLCGVVPLVCQKRYLAAFKVVCPDSTEEGSFESKVRMLGMLVEAVARSEASGLARVAAAEQADRQLDLPSSPGSGQAGDCPAWHPQVTHALEHIEEHLSDPELTVRRIALQLDIHPDYLAHLFAGQVGQRMSAHISARRIERAKNLLATTNWQVKRISREAGFANPNWFHHVFKVHTGQTPAAYRRAASER